MRFYVSVFGTIHGMLTNNNMAVLIIIQNRVTKDRIEVIGPIWRETAYVDFAAFATVLR